jgi:hypothetical protein
VTPGEVLVFNVGDARAYGLRDGRYVCQYTIDDAVAGSEHGITQCLGGGLRSIAPHIVRLDWGGDETIVLTTDGLVKHLSEGEFRAAARAPDPLTTLWEGSVGASDDVGVIVLGRTSTACGAEPPLLGPPGVDVPAPRAGSAGPSRWGRRRVGAPVGSRKTRRIG